MRTKILLIIVTSITFFFSCGKDDNGPTGSENEDNFDYNTKIVYKSYHDGNFEIYLMNADGSKNTRLTTNTADDVEPALSQDGTKIVFESERTGNRDIWIMNSDGSNKTQLTTDNGRDENPRFSPDGSKIVYAASSIVIMNIDGGDPAEIDGTSGGRYPTFSPDGNKIAYTSSGVGDIYMINIDGSNKTRLTTNTTNAEWYPDFSPDGQKIIYTSVTPTIYMELYSIDVDGSNNTSFGISAFHAAFSPDGKKIAFANLTISGNYDIYIMNLDGTGLTQITTYTERDMAPDW